MARGGARLDDPSPGGLSSVITMIAIADIFIKPYAEKVSHMATSEVENQNHLVRMRYDMSHMKSPVALQQGPSHLDALLPRALLAQSH